MECKECKDVGYVYVGKSCLKCRCRLKEDIYEYLGPYFKSAKYNKNLSTDKFDGKNLYLDNGEWDKFSLLVKSYLLNSGLPSMKAVTPFDIVVAFLEEENGKELVKDRIKEMQECDILILVINIDPKNDYYDRYVGSILIDRKVNNRPFWIYSNLQIGSKMFESQYGRLGDIITQNALRVKF